MRTDERLKIIYETAVSMVTRTPETWAKYLDFASRIYKYPFDNALLVYAQDPSASMLATKEIWGRVGRSPADKAKQIAVCEYKNAKNSLKYLLDVTQTVGSVTPQQWTADKNMQTLLALALSERYNLDNPYLGAVIGQFVHATMEQSFEQYMQDFELDIEGHFFAELPKEGLYAQIREITEASARIFVSSRCKIDPIDSDMQAISTVSHFDTIPLVARLGNVVTDVSKHILLEMERTIKLLENERSKNHGEEIESGVHRERWPVVPEHQHRIGSEQPTPGQVRERLDEQPTQKSPSAVHDPADDGRTGSDSTKGGHRSSKSAGNYLSAVADREPAADRGHNDESPTSEQPAFDSGGNDNDRDRLETEISDNQSSPQKEPQGSFSMPEIQSEEPEEHIAAYKNKAESDTNTSEHTVSDHTQDTPFVPQKMTDEEYRIGYEYMLTSTNLYPEGMYIDIRNLYDVDMEISERAEALHKIYNQYGNAELQEDILYRTELRKDDGMSFFIGHGYTYMPWFTIAIIIDGMIADEVYPDPRVQETDDFSDRIGSYNIPDELNEMGGAGDAYEPIIVTDDEYELEPEELYACVDGFLTLSNNLYDGWQNEIVKELEKDRLDETTMYDLFRDIEEEPLSVSGSHVECFAFANYVTIRVDNVDMDFTYPEIADRIKVLIEIGDFAPTPRNTGPQMSLFDFRADNTDNDQAPDASFELDEDTIGESHEIEISETTTVQETKDAPKASSPSRHHKRINYQYSAR